MTTDLNLDGARVSVAPAGADPLCEGVWSELGVMGSPLLTVATPPEPLTAEDFRAALTKTKTMVLEAEYRPSIDPRWFGGIPVVVSEHVPPGIGGIIMDAGLGLRVVAPRAEMREFTDLEREGEWAKRAVRHGLADVLAWLHEDPGPDPDDAYTDPGLFKVNLLGAIAAGVQ